VALSGFVCKKKQSHLHSAVDGGFGGSGLVGSVFYIKKIKNLYLQKKAFNKFCHGVIIYHGGGIWYTCPTLLLSDATLLLIKSRF